MTWLLGIVLVIVGVTHLDDASQAHVRLGWGALAAGVLLCAIAAWQSAREPSPPDQDDE